MSKNTQLGNLVNGIFVDSTGNVGVGNVSPTVALDVTGAGKFSTTVTASGLNFPEKVSTLFGINAATTSGNGGSLTVKAGNGSGSGNTSGSLNLAFGRGGAGAASGSMNFGVAQATDAVGLDATYMTITSSGNVGIGTTAPVWLLEINKNTTSGSTGAYPAISVNNPNAAGYSGYYLYTGTTQKAGFEYNNSANQLSIIANSATRMTIESALVSIYGTNNQERFRLKNTDSAAYLAFTEQDIRMWRPNDSGSALVLATQAISGTWTGGGGGIEFRPLNTLRMTISANGSIGAPSGTNIYNASDARLKQNISTISYGLDTISALNPVKFNWLDGFESSEDGKDMLGFVAQEVQDVIPEAVESFGGTVSLNDGTTIADTLRVNEKFIIPILVKAIQELKAEIETLKNK
jgi:hypothetical protein